MNLEEFWKIIDRAHERAGGDIDERCASLEDQLNMLSTGELQSFQDHYDNAVKSAYRWDLWGAAYVMNGGCSDDGFRYFLDWLVSEGSGTYSEALNAPDSLAELPRVDYAENESFAYIALKVFKGKGAGEINRDFSIELSMPEGEEWNEEELPTMFPKLTKLYEFSM